MVKINSLCSGGILYLFEGNIFWKNSTGHLTQITGKSELKKGVTCCKCNDYNEYLDTPSELNGKHICYGCKYS